MASSMMTDEKTPAMKQTDAHYLTHEAEGECFDVKSARIKPADLAELD